MQSIHVVVDVKSYVSDTGDYSERVIFCAVDLVRIRLHGSAPADLEGASIDIANYYAQKRSFPGIGLIQNLVSTYYKSLCVATTEAKYITPTGKVSHTLAVTVISPASNMMLSIMPDSCPLHCGQYWRDITRLIYN